MDLLYLIFIGLILNTHGDGITYTNPNFDVQYDVAEPLNTGNYVDVYGHFNNPSDKVSLWLTRSKRAFIRVVIEFAKTSFLSFQVSPHLWSLPVELENPLFREGRAFKITIVVNDDYNRVLFNDQPLTGCLPRTSEVIDSFSISYQKVIRLKVIPSPKLRSIQTRFTILQLIRYN